MLPKNITTRRGIIPPKNNSTLIKVYKQENEKHYRSNLDKKKATVLIALVPTEISQQYLVPYDVFARTRINIIFYIPYTKTIICIKRGTINPPPPTLLLHRYYSCIYNMFLVVKENQRLIFTSPPFPKTPSTDLSEASRRVKAFWKIIKLLRL